MCWAGVQQRNQRPNSDSVVIIHSGIKAMHRMTSGHTLYYDGVDRVPKKWFWR